MCCPSTTTHVQTQTETDTHAHRDREQRTQATQTTVECSYGNSSYILQYLHQHFHCRSQSVFVSSKSFFDKRFTNVPVVGHFQFFVHNHNSMVIFVLCKTSLDNRLETLNNSFVKIPGCPRDRHVAQWK